MIKIPSFTVSDVFCGILIIVLSVLYGFWWLLWYLDHCIVCPLRFLMTSVVSWSLHCLSFTVSDDFCGILIIVLSVLYGFWWLLWYLDHCIVCPLQFLMTSVVSWSLYCLFFTVSDDFCGILYNDQDTTKVIRNRKGQTIQWSRYHRSHQEP
jgi:hypothetical protein